MGDLGNVAQDADNGARSEHRALAEPLGDLLVRSWTGGSAHEVGRSRYGEGDDTLEHSGSVVDCVGSQTRVTLAKDVLRPLIGDLSLFGRHSDEQADDLRSPTWKLLEVEERAAVCPDRTERRIGAKVGAHLP